MVNELDTDGDHLISFEEFKNAINIPLEETAEVWLESLNRDIDAIMDNAGNRIGDEEKGEDETVSLVDVSLEQQSDRTMSYEREDSVSTSQVKHDTYAASSSKRKTTGGLGYIVVKKPQLPRAVSNPAYSKTENFKHAIHRVATLVTSKLHAPEESPANKINFL